MSIVELALLLDSLEYSWKYKPSNDVVKKCVIGFVQKLFLPSERKKSYCGVTWFCPSLPIHYSGTINLVPKKFDQYLNTILCDYLEIFDSCHITAAVIWSIFLVNIEQPNLTAVVTNSSSFCYLNSTLTKKNMYFLSSTSDFESHIVVTQWFRLDSL